MIRLEPSKTRLLDRAVWQAGGRGVFAKVAGPRPARSTLRDVPDHTTDRTTELICRVREGDRSALDELVPLVYSELRKMASAYLRNEKPGHTLQPTALINELYLGLVGASHRDLLNRTHFLGVAAFLTTDSHGARAPAPRGQAWWCRHRLGPQ